MASEAEELLSKVLKYFQSTPWIRKSILTLMILGLAAVCAFYAYSVMPKTYTLTMTGGDVLGNRHFVTKTIQEEIVSDGVNVKVRPTDGNLWALQKVAEHKIDLALVQGGMKKIYPGVYQLASLSPEIVHLVVKPSYKKITDLKGATINVGEEKDGTHAIVTEIMKFSGFEEGVDYATTNFSSEDLVSVPPQRLPDAMFIVSLAPSYLVEFLVRERGYQLIEIPFPEALALHNGWTAGVSVLPYTYNVNPPVPATPIKSVGVPMMLVTHDKVNPTAAVKVMETLFGKAVANRTNVSISDANITASTGYPLSPVVFKYLNRNESLLSQKTVSQAKDWFGAVMSFATTILVLYRWFRAKKPEEPQTADDSLTALLTELSGLPASAETPQAALSRLDEIREEVIRLKTGMPVKDASLTELALLMIVDTRNRIAASA